MIRKSSDNHIDDKDIIRMSYLPLDKNLPSYDRRASAYIRRVLKEKPDVMLLQGLDPDEYSIPGLLDQLEGTAVVGEYVRTCTERRGMRSSINATWVRKGIRIIDIRRIRMAITIGGAETVIAPDALAVTINRHGIVFDLYNIESVPGALNEELRRQAACIINGDAYRMKTRTSHHFDSTMVLAGDLHAVPEASSIRYLKGLETIRKATPSEWRDVWEELSPAHEHDEGIMARMDVVGRYDDGMVLPQFHRPRKTSYVMVYDDALGRKGTPVRIERNGTGSDLGDGTPLSGSYGMDVDFYCPQ